MNARTKELRELKKPSIQALWFWILLSIIFLCAITFWIYIVSVFQYRYNIDAKWYLNDIIILITSGILIGLLLLMLSFTVLKMLKKALIKNFFEFYCYLNSLHSKHNLTLIKDTRFLPLYTSNKMQTCEEYINFIASILKYEPTSIDYKNLKYEIEEDFAKHAFKDPDFLKLRSDTFSKVIFLDLIAPALVATMLIVLSILYPSKNDEPLRAIPRFAIVLASIILTLAISISTYELVMCAKIKNIETFNNFFMFSFNSYKFKLLNSSIVKIR